MRPMAKASQGAYSSSTIACATDHCQKLRQRSLARGQTRNSQTRLAVTNTITARYKLYNPSTMKRM